MKQLYFETLADFKRKAEVGKFVLGGYYDKHQKGWREIKKKQSNGLSLKTEVVGRSFFDFPKARDCEIEQEQVGSVLKIYQDRAVVGGNDIPADISWLKYDIETGRLKESEVMTYRKQVAEYKLGEE